jgi:DNA processing protein
VLSQFPHATPSRKYNFVLRNELAVALGEVLVVSYADENSGTLRSVEYAQAMGKKIYVLPHRIGESEATNKLLAQNKAEAIYDIEKFVAMFCNTQEGGRKQQTDPFLDFCATTPTYEEALKRFPAKIFEAELMGQIEVKNAKVYLGAK